MYDEAANGAGTTNPSGKFLAFLVVVFPALAYLLLSNQAVTVVFLSGAVGKFMLGAVASGSEIRPFMHNLV